MAPLVVGDRLPCRQLGTFIILHRDPSVVRNTQSRRIHLHPAALGFTRHNLPLSSMFFRFPVHRIVNSYSTLPIITQSLATVRYHLNTHNFWWAILPLRASSVLTNASLILILSICADLDCASNYFLTYLLTYLLNRHLSWVETRITICD